MLLPVLLWRHFVLVSESLNKMAAIGKSGFLADIIQVKIGKKEQILSLAKADKFNIFFTGLAIEVPEAFGKIGITHITHSGKVFHL